MSDYDPSRDPPGIGRKIALGVIAAVFGAGLLASWLGGLIRL